MPFVSSMDSANLNRHSKQVILSRLKTTESTDESPQGSCTDDTNTKCTRKGPFLPIHKNAKRNRKYPNSEDLISEIHETMNNFLHALKNDSTKELIVAEKRFRKTSKK